MSKNSIYGFLCDTAYLTATRKKYPEMIDCQASVDPASIVEAVKEMDAGQLSTIASLLGVETKHPFLYLPSALGGFITPSTKAHSR